jgi:hypothetical protein
VGTFNPKPENRTKPNRNRTELSVFRFFGLASVFIIGRFGCRFGDRFCLPTEPKNRTDRITGAPSNPSILSSCVTARLCSLPFPTMARGLVGFNNHGTKAHHAMPIVSSLKNRLAYPTASGEWMSTVAARATVQAVSGALPRRSRACER